MTLKNTIKKPRFLLYITDNFEKQLAGHLVHEFYILPPLPQFTQPCAQSYLTLVNLHDPYSYGESVLPFRDAHNYPLVQEIIIYLLPNWFYLPNPAGLASAHKIS